MNMEATGAGDFSLEQLCVLGGMPKRTVRYYIQRGLVDRPSGETRAARYGTRHLEQLIEIRRWVRSGVSLRRIAELLGGAEATMPARPRGAGAVDVWTHLVAADGVEVMVEPQRAALTPAQLREFLRRVRAAYQAVQRGE